MSTIILSSSGKTIFIDEIEKKLPKKFKDYKIAYITTASQEVDDRNYIDIRLKQMKYMNLNFQELDISDFNKETLENELEKYNIIYVEGGNTFYLLQEIRKTGFEKIIKKLLDKGTIYIGSSAGTYVACPTIDMALLSTHNFNMFGIEKYNAMNLVDFYIKAHYTNTEEEKGKLNLKATELQEKIYAFTDYQALFIKDGEFMFCGDKENVIFGEEK